MSRYWGDFPQYSQPNAAELKKKSAASKKKEKAKGKVLKPVIINGRAIVSKWWGKAWCDNLEKYADYESRLDRGKRYVRTGAVIDLQIQKGKILARVQGTRKTPYKVEIRISPLSEEKCQAIIERCGRKLENLEALLAGDFPEEMQELFQSKDGLFPARIGRSYASMWRQRFMEWEPVWTRIPGCSLNSEELRWKDLLM